MRILLVSRTLYRSVSRTDRLSFSRRAFAPNFTGDSAEGCRRVTNRMWHTRLKMLFMSGGIATFVAATTSLLVFGYLHASEKEACTMKRKKTAAEKILMWLNVHESKKKEIIDKVYTHLKGIILIL